MKKYLKFILSRKSKNIDYFYEKIIFIVCGSNGPANYNIILVIFFKTLRLKNIKIFKKYLLKNNFYYLGVHWTPKSKIAIFFKIYSEFYDLKLKKSKKDFIKIDFLKKLVVIFVFLCCKI